MKIAPCSLLFRAWYQDDGVVAGLKHAVSRALSIILEHGPPLGLFINAARCKLYSLSGLNMFPSESVPRLEILGVLIGDATFCGQATSC